MANRSNRYLSGNFAPIHRTRPLTSCVVEGNIPEDLAGGQYVRNGGNPVTNESQARDAHWFDGDGMLTGVSFRTCPKNRIQPEFVNQYVLTDLYLASTASRSLRTPVLPSIATLVNPLSSVIFICLRVFRTLVLVLLSQLPGSRQPIKKVSVANTALQYHDGRALATCESGPPMRIALPGLDTIGWFNGRQSQNEGIQNSDPGFGGVGALRFFNEWTTAHPRVDRETDELILYHSTFFPPYVHYSVVPAKGETSKQQSLCASGFLGKSVPGINVPKLMHDFGVTRNHTIILDLPLTLDPLNLARNKPVVEYDPASRSRFGVFPRYRPDQIRWFETNPCCIFHTANSWDEPRDATLAEPPDSTLVNMLACRLTSASIVFSAGDVAAPMPICPIPEDQREEEQCRLYYYQFDLDGPSGAQRITHQWALAAIPFEFPTLRESSSMSSAKYIYGCSVSDSTFGAALGRATKINSLVKIDGECLIARGKDHPPETIRGCVDSRSMNEILDSQDEGDPIRIFKLPNGWFAQEPRFVPRENGTSEDDGWILTYVFDESQLDESGECTADCKSELWIIDALRMVEVVAKIHLPQRVPYGLHGMWFSAEQVESQRPYADIRRIPSLTEPPLSSRSWISKIWIATRKAIEDHVG